VNKNVIIIGASGHGHVIADIVLASGDNLVGFLDDDVAKDTLGIVSDYKKYADCEFIVGVGNTEIRKNLSLLPLKWHTAIHPSAVISPSSRIGEGTVVMPNAVVNAQSIIGNHCIINSGAIVEHNNIIGNYSHISVGAKLGGTVTLGESVWIGIGAVVSNNLSIDNDVIIGAGSVVVKNILMPGKYIGVPAKKM